MIFCDCIYQCVSNFLSVYERERERTQLHVISNFICYSIKAILLDFVFYAPSRSMSAVLSNQRGEYQHQMILSGTCNVSLSSFIYNLVEMDAFSIRICHWRLDSLYMEKKKWNPLAKKENKIIYVPGNLYENLCSRKNCFILPWQSLFLLFF